MSCALCTVPLQEARSGIGPGGPRQQSQEQCTEVALHLCHCLVARLVLPWVGEVRALTIGHNNKGPGPEWHLEMVEVIDEQHGPKSYWFACNR
jgi:hypothetical protein